MSRVIIINFSNKYKVTSCERYKVQRDKKKEKKRRGSPLSLSFSAMEKGRYVSRHDEISTAKKMMRAMRHVSG